MFDSHFVDVQESQTAVSHSGGESEIISLDAGLRMDGFNCSSIWGVCAGNIVSQEASQEELRASQS